MLVAKEVTNGNSVSDLPMNQELRVMSILDSFVNHDESGMVQLEEVALGTVKNIPDVQRWNSGFTPLDLVTGGLYKGVLVIMARPGGGKTSTMIAMVEALKRTRPDCNIVFFEEETPQSLMLSRMKPVFDRIKFGKDDLLVTGGTTITEIMDRLAERDRKMRKEKRIVFVDSPDTMPGLSAENRRFELGFIYRQLVKIKQQPSTELVVVASQPNRKSKGVLTLQSVAESWEKAWLVDMVIGINQAGFDRLRMKVLKNRFGIPDQEVLYHFNFENFTWEDAVLDEEDDW